MTGDFDILEASVFSDGNLITGLQHFTINGIPLVSSPPVPTVNSSGIITQVDFYATFDVNFKKYAEPDGSIEVIAFGELDVKNNYTPVYNSNSISLSIAPPLVVPGGNDDSTAIDLFSNLCGKSINNAQLKQFQYIKMLVTTQLKIGFYILLK